MKRFTSKFAAIQRIREQQEKIAAAELANAQREFQAAQTALESSKDALKATFAEMQTMMQKSCGAGGLRAGQRQSAVGQQAVQHRQREFNQQQQLVNAAIQRRTLAFQELRTIDEATKRERATYRKQQVTANLMIQMENFRPTTTESTTAGHAADNAERQS